MVNLVATEAEWQAALRATKGAFGGQGLVVDFTASWCGPCKMIAPVFEELAKQNPNVTFCKVDVDQLQEVASACGVRAMPTFQSYFNGEKVNELVGADQNKLKAMVQEVANRGVSGAGQKVGGSAAGASPADETPEQRRARMVAAAEARFKQAGQ